MSKYERQNIELPGFFSLRPIDTGNVFQFQPLSASQVERFIACPHCFYESSREKVKAKTTASLTGESLHDLAARITHPTKSRNLSIKKPNELLDYMSHEWPQKLLEDAKESGKKNKYQDIYSFLKNLNGENPSRQRIAKNAVRMQLMIQKDNAVYPFVEHSFAFFLSTGKTYWQEFAPGSVALAAPIPKEVALVGQIDQVVALDRETEVRDLKFGVSSFKDSFALQIGIYALAALPLEISKNSLPKNLLQRASFPKTSIWDIEQGSIYQVKFPDPEISSATLAELVFWTKVAKESNFRRLEPEHEHIMLKGVNYVMPGLWEETSLKNEEMRMEINGRLVEAKECFDRAKYFWQLFQKMYEVKKIPNDPEIEAEVDYIVSERNRVLSSKQFAAS